MERKIKPEIRKSSLSTYVALGVLIFCLLSIVVLLLSKQSATRQDYQAPSIATTDPQKQVALKAVQNQNTILASNMHESIAVILVILENDGHTQSIDGWYVSKESSYYSVKFYFYLDGNHEYAEWWYYPDTDSISAKNDWAFTFMGE